MEATVYASNLRNMINDIRDEALNLKENIDNMLMEYDMASTQYADETDREYSEDIFEDYFGYVVAMELLSDRIMNEII